jgi:outer membrane protein OmpA-like peptidoglycan-associated protein
VREEARIIMTTMADPQPRQRARAIVPPTLAFCLVIVATPGLAQVVIGGRSHSVTVNPDVLDALGPPPGVPQLLDPGLSGSAAPRLTTPGTRGAPGDVPRSRLYAVPGVGTSPPAPRSGLAIAPGTSPSPAPAASPEPPRALVQTPRVSEPPPRAPAATPAAAPPIPPERSAPRAAMASPPPPAPALDTPAPTPPPVAPTPPIASTASPPPSAPASAPPSPRPSAPPAAASAPPASPPPQVAAAAGTLSRVMFAPGSADLSDDGRRELTGLAQRLGREGDTRIQLLAYADGTPDNESQARRLSLSRALAVRSFLIEQGIRSTRVNVQALGIKGAGGPPDRVDAMAATP